MPNISRQRMIELIELVDLPGHDAIADHVRHWYLWLYRAQFIAWLTVLVGAALIGVFAYGIEAGTVCLWLLIVPAIYLLIRLVDRIGHTESVVVVVAAALAGGIWHYGLDIFVFFFLLAGPLSFVIYWLGMLLLAIVHACASPIIYLFMTPVTNKVTADIEHRFPEWIGDFPLLGITWQEIRLIASERAIYFRNKAARLNGTNKRRYTLAQMLGSQTVPGQHEHHATGEHAFEHPFPAVNPTTGLPMTNHGTDVGGNHFGHQIVNPGSGLPTVNNTIGSPDIQGNTWGSNQH